MHDLMSLGIVFLGPPNIHGRALELATQLNQTAAYDSHYLALAETLNCALWTADARFYRAAPRHSGAGRNPETPSPYPALSAHERVFGGRLALVSDRRLKHEQLDSALQVHG